jgi:hypothetical protein
VIALRWVVGSAAAVFGLGWVLLVVAANGFRRSFGASPNGWWVVAVPVIVAALVVATAVRPRWPLALLGRDGRGAPPPTGPGA